MSNNNGILLISHGSSLPYGEVTFNEIKYKFIKKTGFATEVGYMKVSQPSIAGAVEILKNELISILIELICIFDIIMFFNSGIKSAVTFNIELFTIISGAVILIFLGEKLISAFLISV